MGEFRKMSDKLDLRQEALDYHSKEPAGKVAIYATKPMSTQRDLSLAYSPGVAVPCEEIAKDPLKAYDYTAKGNVVAVISNGTAVLGLGDIGALASKPVMEGKAVLFKKFADIDSIDIEVDEKDVDTLVETIARLEPSFGGINLEDIRAPECFEVEERLRERMNIPVFHDDQHGTAIIVSAAFYNWIKLTGRDLKKIKLVSSGAGASAIACLNLLVDLGLPRENITVTDRAGVLYKGREEDNLHPKKAIYARETDDRTLADAIKDADVFLGLSAPGVLTKDMVKTMAKEPLIMALANPTPEILPEEVMEARDDATIATGRSDYPNQVNNVLCFPFIFRGALDVGATTINEEMKIACVKALASITMQEGTAEVAEVYGDENLTFGKEYLIPKPFDPRLVVELPIAVAKAAMDSGVAKRPITDWDAYRHKLESNIFRSGMLMRPVFQKAKESPKRICFAEGEDVRVLRAAQVLIDDKIAFPILVGRTEVVLSRIESLGLRMEKDKDFEICNPQDDPRYVEYWSSYWDKMYRKGVTKSIAKKEIRTNTTIIAAIMVERGEADGLICGTSGLFQDHRKDVVDVIGMKQTNRYVAALSGMITPKGTVFITDAYANTYPTVMEISEAVFQAVREVRKFGLTPRVALLSHSNYGSRKGPSVKKMREALDVIMAQNPDFEIDGEMHADAALCDTIRGEIVPNSKLTAPANILVMPDADCANISFNLLKMLSDGLPVGPLLLGVAKPANILTPTATTRAIVNVAALTVVGAQMHEKENAS